MPHRTEDNRPNLSKRGKLSAAKKLDVKKRRSRIAELLQRNKSQEEIADFLGVSQSTISNDCKAVQQEWIERANVNFEEQLARDIAMLVNLRTAALESYKRSCQDAIAISKTMRGGEVITTHKTASQNGDVKFIQEIRMIDEQLRKLTGLEVVNRYRDLNEAIKEVSAAGYQILDPGTRMTSEGSQIVDIQSGSKR